MSYLAHYILSCHRWITRTMWSNTAFDCLLLIHQFYQGLRTIYSLFYLLQTFLSS